MTSPSPLRYNTYYHIYNRGVNRENLFVEERNYDLFLRLYEKHLSPVTDLFAYCLLKNHFHLSLRVKGEEEIFNGFLLNGKRIVTHREEVMKWFGSLSNAGFSS